MCNLIKKWVLCWALFLPIISWGAIGSTAIWEVRTTGDDTNGGAFIAGAAGTDWSQQNSAQYSVTDGVTAGTTTITSATATFGVDVVGNIMYVAGGTGSVTGGWYQITARTNATTITVDRSTGLTAGTGVTLKIGGALATPQRAITNWVSGNGVYIKSGTYTISSALTTATVVGPNNIVSGYGTTRGDNVQATIKATAAITLWSDTTASNYTLQNLIFDGDNTGTNGVLINNGSSICAVKNCVVKNLTGYGITTTSTFQLIGTEIFNCNTSAGLYFTANNTVSTVSGCYIHGNTVPGIVTLSPYTTITNSIIANNSGATTDGIIDSSVAHVHSCVFYGNGRDGLRNTTSTFSAIAFGSLINNIFANNTGYGVNFSAVTNPSGFNVAVMNRDNAFYNNTAGHRNNFTEPNSTDLVTDPFVDAAGGNWALKPSSSLVTSGFPTTFGTASTTSYHAVGVSASGARRVGSVSTGTAGTTRAGER